MKLENGKYGLYDLVTNGEFFLSKATVTLAIQCDQHCHAGSLKVISVVNLWTTFAFEFQNTCQIDDDRQMLMYMQMTDLLRSTIKMHIHER